MANEIFTLTINATKAICPVGQEYGKRNIEDGKIPVLSCEGACIRGEIARLAANMVAKKDPYRRACHGELFTIPNSAIAKWVKESGKVVVIDGCFLRCHGRILEPLLGKDSLLQFDAYSHYKKYSDRFDIDSVPVDEVVETASDVADWVTGELEKMG